MADSCLGSARWSEPGADKECNSLSGTAAGGRRKLKKAAESNRPRFSSGFRSLPRSSPGGLPPLPSDPLEKCPWRPAPESSAVCGCLWPPGSFH
eukprot:12240954-Alexandrium_andersonii.AAC.1